MPIMCGLVGGSYSVDLRFKRISYHVNCVNINKAHKLLHFIFICFENASENYESTFTEQV